MRIEQLAPPPRRRLAETLDRCPNVEEKFWVQEASATGVLAKVRPGAARAVVRTGWPASSRFRGGPSAPSSGSSKLHAVERQEILDEAFT